MTQDRIPLDAESSRPAMEGETNELDARGLRYAETAVHFAGDDADAKALAEAAIRAYRKHSALPSAPAVEGVEPVIWVSEGQLHAMSPDCDDDSASGRYLPMRRSEGGNFKFPLYPASAISRLVKERDETLNVPNGCLNVGHQVRKTSGYPFPGEVRSVFKTRAGLVRYVIEATGEDYAGMLHIFSPGQLAAIRNLKEPSDEH